MATTTNFGWETPDDTDLVKDGAAAIRTALNGVDTSFVDLKGGTTGQVLSKASGTDLDFTWVEADDTNAIQNSIIDAKGDLIVGASDNTPARLPIGSNNYVLTADSSQTYGVKWAAPASGGKVLQVVSTTKTDTFTTTSSTYVDVTGYSVSITPTSSTSKILVIYDININADPSTHNGWGKLVRNSTDIKIGDSVGGRPQVTIAKEAANYYNDLSGQAGSFLDSPATTSTLTYKIQVARVGGSGSDIVCVNRTEQDNTDRPRGACTITVMEIGA